MDNIQPSVKKWWDRQPLRALLITLRVLFVASVVGLHFLVFAIRNPLDLWESEIKDALKEEITIGGMAGMNKPGHGALLIATVREPVELDQTEFQAAVVDLWVAGAGSDAIAPLVLPFYLARFSDLPPAVLWDDELFRSRFTKANDITYKLVNRLGVEQRWSMFTPPLARRADFLSVRLEFTDDSTDTMRSANEPADWTNFLRIGGWQTRKLEDYLVNDPNEYHPTERGIWEAYARYKMTKWRAQRPGDPREVSRVVFVRHRMYFLDRVANPKQTPAELNKRNSEAESREIARFNAKGELLP